MKTLEYIPVVDKHRHLFQSIMEDFISRGYYYTTLVAPSNRAKGILGYFVKEID